MAYVASADCSACASAWSDQNIDKDSRLSHVGSEDGIRLRAWVG